MYLLNEGRGNFLEFLRNLTPQAGLLALAFVDGSRMDFSRVDFRNWPSMFVLVSLLLIWTLAAWANGSLFFERSLVRVSRLERGLRRLARRGIRFRFGYLAVVLAWRYQRRLFLEIVLVMLILEFGLVMVVTAAAASALNLLKLQT